MKHTIILALVCILAVALAGCQSVMGGNYTLYSGQTISGDLSIYGGNSTLESGSRVTGSIYVVGGNTQANGQVDGDVIVTGGTINFGPSAVVRGAAQQSGGAVHIADGAAIKPIEYGTFASNRWAGSVLGGFVLFPILLIAALVVLIGMGSLHGIAPQMTARQGAGDAVRVRDAGLGGSIAAGAILIMLGILFFFQQLLNVDVWHYLWPFMFLMPGLLCFALMFMGGKSEGRLAVPGSILTMLGLICLFQNTFNQFQTWAYAWTLILAAVGIGQFIQGWWTDRRELREPGLIRTRNGLIVFLIFAAFFELVLNLSGWFWGDLARFAFPAVLILVGMLLLFGRFLNRPVTSS